MADIFDPRHQPLATRTREYILVPADDSGKVFASRETTVLDEHGCAVTHEEVRVQVAGCCHIVGRDPSELISVCSEKGCFNTLCSRCGNLRCSHCLRIVCQTHARRFKESVYCRHCWWIEFAKTAGWLSLKGMGWVFYGSFHTIKWLLIAVFRVLAWMLRRSPPPPSPPMVMR